MPKLGCQTIMYAPEAAQVVRYAAPTPQPIGPVAIQTAIVASP